MTGRSRFGVNRLTGTWDVFDPDGRFVGRLAGQRNPRWFDGEHLVTKEWGPFDQEYVVVYRVVPAPVS